MAGCETSAGFHLDRQSGTEVRAPKRQSRSSARRGRISSGFPNQLPALPGFRTAGSGLPAVDRLSTLQRGQRVKNATKNKQANRRNNNKDKGPEGHAMDSACSMRRPFYPGDKQKGTCGSCSPGFAHSSGHTEDSFLDSTVKQEVGNEIAQTQEHPHCPSSG